MKGVCFAVAPLRGVIGLDTRESRGRDTALT